MAVGAAIALAVGASPGGVVRIVAVSTAVGVSIDLDHFLVARYNAGDWRALRSCVRDPRLAVLDQPAIFRPGEVGKLQRLLSHALVGGGVVAGLAALDARLAGVAAASLYAHVVADLIADLRELDGAV